MCWPPRLCPNINTPWSVQEQWRIESLALILYLCFLCKFDDCVSLYGRIYIKATNSSFSVYFECPEIPVIHGKPPVPVGSAALVFVWYTIDVDIDVAPTAVVVAFV